VPPGFPRISRRELPDSPAEQGTSDLAAPAAREAMATAGIEPADLDLIVVAHVERPEEVNTAMAAFLQRLR
jgi:3-oxoacyl-[acyl-carrier-protein] synthase III